MFDVGFNIRNLEGNLAELTCLTCGKVFTVDKYEVKLTMFKHIQYEVGCYTDKLTREALLKGVNYIKDPR